MPLSDQNLGHLDAGIQAIGLLDDPVRRRVYFSVPPWPESRDRDRVASELGISRGLAAFHLDKLAEGGLLEVSYRRVNGRAGRGAGRPRKLYQRSREDTIAVSLPQRDYSLIASLFADALEAGGRRSHAKIAAVARNQGVELGRSVSSTAGFAKSRRSQVAIALALLTRQGYDPYIQGREIFMRNCPFHAVAKEHRQLVCAANRAMLDGFAMTLESAGLRADYEPADNRCCVVLRPV